MIKLITAAGRRIRGDVPFSTLQACMTATDFGVNSYAFIGRDGRLTRVHQLVSVRLRGVTVSVLEETPISSQVRPVSLVKGA